MTQVDDYMETLPGKTKDAKIMIVEDERIVAMDIKESIRAIGYNVVGVAHSGEKAIEMVKEKKPDLILMDIMLKGGIDGISTTEKLHKDYNIPVVYLTAYADEVTLSRAKITEPSGYLLKPFEQKELHTTIETALYNHQMEQKVKESEKWLTTTLNSIGEGMIATGADGKIKMFNPVAENLSGWKKNEVLGEDISAVFIINDENLEYIEDPISHVLRTGNILKLKNNICLKNKNGKMFSINATASPIKNNGENVGAILVFQDITEQKKIERERENLLQEVMEARERLKQLSKRLIEIQETDRRYFAYELHEQIGQSLTSIKIHLQTLLMLKDNPYKEQLNDSVSMLENIIKEVRRLSLSLRPSMLDDLGLVPAIRWFIKHKTKETNIETVIEADELSKIPSDVENMCYRIAQEGITNVVRHSEATKLTVSINLNAGDMVLKVEDNGKGFDVEKVLKKNIQEGSMGINGMKERVELLGGEFKIISSPGKGTAMYAAFPVSNKNNFEVPEKENR